MHIKPCSRRGFLRSIPAALALAGTAASAQDARTAPAAPHPLERLLAEGEAARSRSIPKPEDGVRDMQWSEFSPRGWKPALTLDKARVSGWKDDDPRAVKLMADLQKDWQKAPAVTALPDGLIRIYGYPAMPEGEARTTKKIILAPYYGSCVHSPPPPANQLIFVDLKTEIPATMYQFPIWVTGRIAAKSKSINRVRAAYSMDDAKWEPYLYLKYPMRRYRLPF